MMRETSSSVIVSSRARHFLSLQAVSSFLKGRFDTLDVISTFIDSSEYSLVQPLRQSQRVSIGRSPNCRPTRGSPILSTIFGLIIVEIWSSTKEEGLRNPWVGICDLRMKELCSRFGFVERSCLHDDPSHLVE
jgi:hypothetical protein